MNCVQAHHLFDAHLDGELSGTLLFELETHLLHCPVCQRAYQIRLTVGEIVKHDLSEPQVSEGFAERVMQALKQSKVEVVVGQDERMPLAPDDDFSQKIIPFPVAPARRWKQRWLMSLSAAAAAVLLFIFVPMQSSNRDSSDVAGTQDNPQTPMLAQLDGPSSIVDHVGKAVSNARSNAASLGWVASVSWPSMLAGTGEAAGGAMDEDSGPI